MRREKIKTHVEVTPEDETGSFSIVHIKTRDRPGLLTDIVRTLKDLNVNVISAEVKPPTPMLTGTKRISVYLYTTSVPPDGLANRFTRGKDKLTAAVLSDAATAYLQCRRCAACMRHCCASKAAEVKLEQ